MTLLAGETYNIPYGKNPRSYNVRAASLSSQTVGTAVAGEINGDITGSQFRTEENGYAYYYFFTDNGAHGYSVAYNTSTGEFVCEQNY